MREPVFDRTKLQIYIPWRVYFIEPKHLIWPGIIFAALIIVSGLADSTHIANYFFGSAVFAVLYVTASYLFLNDRTNPKWVSPLMIDRQGIVGRSFLINRAIDWQDVNSVEYVHSLLGPNHPPIEFNLMIQLRNGKRRRIYVPDMNDSEFNDFGVILSKIAQECAFIFSSERRL